MDGWSGVGDVGRARSRPARRWSLRRAPCPSWGPRRAAAGCSGCCGSRQISLDRPVSTISPAFMTATRSQTCRTTERSCETNTRVRSSSSTRSVMRLSTCARTDTSSALTGSSATQDPRRRRERPGDRDALALSAGELVRVPVGRVRRADRPRRAARRPGRRSAGWRLARRAARRRCPGRACAGRASSSGPGTPAAGSPAGSRSRRSGSRAMSVPSTTTLPLVGRSSPARSRSSVDLPQPDSPTMPNRSPACDLEAHALAARATGGPALPQRRPRSPVGRGRSLVAR